LQNCQNTQAMHTFEQIGRNQNFNTVLIRLVAWIKSSLLVKIQWKQHHILYVQIVYKKFYDTLKSPRPEGEGRGSRLKLGLRK
jgi:hypothetical protein